MITKEQILALAKEHLKNTSLFVTGVKIGSDNHINVFIDGDEGVKIEDCVKLSRAIESQLDRDREDFALDVSSHGASSPLILPRQYRRHIGRELAVQLSDGSRMEGRLAEWNEKGVTLEWETREDKPIGKGKHTVLKKQALDFESIKEARIKLKF